MAKANDSNSPLDSSRLVVASAARFEAENLLQVLARQNRVVTFVEVGVGPIRSAAVSMSLRKIVAGRPVLFVGSCGASLFSGSPTLIAADSVEWRPVDVRAGDSYVVQNTETLKPLSPLNFDHNLPRVQVSCSGSITLKAELKENVFENLELYSVACSWLGVCQSFSAVLGVTNQLGPDAHLEWRQNFKIIGAQIANFFESNGSDACTVATPGAR